MKLKQVITGIASATLLSASAIALADPSTETGGINSAAPASTEPSVADKIESKTKSAVNKTEQVASDSWITTKVKSALLADDLTKGLKISVKTAHQIVELSGTVESQATADHAADLAKQIKGVASVNVDDLKVVNKVSSN